MSLEKVVKALQPKSNCEKRAQLKHAKNVELIIANSSDATAESAQKKQDALKRELVRYKRELEEC